MSQRLFQGLRLADGGAEKKIDGMRELIINTCVKVCGFEEFSADDRKLINEAREAATRCYAPYSRFGVGAAVRLQDGRVVTGNNQENAAYPSGTCAERTTLFWANAQYPDVPVDTLAIAARSESGELARPISPCGACRQVILEVEKRYNRPIRIILFGTDECYLVEDGIRALLPLCFDADFLE